MRVMSSSCWWGSRGVTVLAGWWRRDSVGGTGRELVLRWRPHVGWTVRWHPPGGGIVMDMLDGNGAAQCH